jgi:hypothetical protein
MKWIKTLFKGNKTKRPNTTSKSENDHVIRFETKWFYDGPDDENVRDFCRQLLDATNSDGSKPKLYTREEIDKLQNGMEDYNSDVWKYKGGWYYNPELDQTFPQCRHWWRQKIVRVE